MKDKVNIGFLKKKEILKRVIDIVAIFISLSLNVVKKNPQNKE